MSDQPGRTNFNYLSKITATLNRSVELREAVEEALYLVVELLGLDSAWAFHFHDGEQDFHLLGFTGLPPALEQDDRAELSYSGCECQQRFQAGRLDEAVNIVRCSRLQKHDSGTGGLEVHASIPLVSGGQRLGIMNVASPDYEPFSDEALAFLTHVGMHIGDAIARTQQSKRLAAMAERQQLARDLHDSVSQALFSMRLTTEAARTKLRDPVDREEVDSLLQQLTGQITGALGQMRSLVSGLHQDVQAEQFAAALREHRGQFPPGPPSLELAVDPGALPAESSVRKAMLAIAQEALTNVMKHAAAEQVTVSVRRESVYSVLEVSDNGCGFEVGTAPAGTYGLTSMHGRASDAGGRLEITSSVNGTTVKAYFPREELQ